MIRKKCDNCAKHENDDCDNYDMRPLRRCFVPSEKAQDMDDSAAEMRADEARDRRMLESNQA